MTKDKGKNIKKTESSDDEIFKNEEEIKRLKSLLKPLKQRNEILKQRKNSEKTKIYYTTLDDIEKKIEKLIMGGEDQPLLLKSMMRNQHLLMKSMMRCYYDD